MRFPIEYERRKMGIKDESGAEIEVVNFTNLSEALRESLEDEHMGIIDEKTGEPKQDYFDLEIEQGPLLTYLFELFDMVGSFHVGCTLDARPPNFGFSISRGHYRTREGAFLLQYWRDLKLSVFLKNASFRNERGVRDLIALAKAYKKGDYEERVSIGWSGWTGDQGEPIFRNDDGKRVFEGCSIRLKFDGDFLTEVDSIDCLGEGCFGTPKVEFYGGRTPFYELGKGTKLLEIARAYGEQKDRLRRHNPQLMYGYTLPDLGYGVEDVLTGILQIASKIFPAKHAVESDAVRAACSSYRPAPKDFDADAEGRLHLRLTGGVY